MIFPLTQTIFLMLSLVLQRKKMETSIALEVEIPEETYVLLANFIESHASLDFNEVVSLAVSNFLKKQNMSTNGSVPNSNDVTNFKPI